MATRTTLFGDKFAADALRVPAHNQLAILKSQMLHQKLKQGERMLKFDDGTIFQYTSVFGFDQVKIYVPLVLEVEKQPQIDVFINLSYVYYIEIVDPDFTYYRVPHGAPPDALPAQNGHKFFYIIPDFYSQINVVVVNNEYASRAAIESAIAQAVNDLNIKLEVYDGLTYGVIEFSVDIISKMFPKSSDWSAGDAAWGRTNFREAKAFTINRISATGETFVDRYVGYCSGILRKTAKDVTENIFDSFDSHVAAKRKYHQFHIINGLFVWFGMEHEAESGYPDWVNLNVKVYTSNASTGITKVYEFVKFDYLNILGSAESDIFCDGPTPGNVIGYLRPPAYIDHVANVSKSEITIIAKAEHGLGSLCGSHDYEDYGCGSGSYIEMTFLASGLQIKGDRSFGFTDQIWEKDRSTKQGASMLASSATDSVDDLAHDNYTVAQETSVNFKAEMLTSSRHIANQYANTIIMIEGSPQQSVDHAWILEADAEHTPRWTPVKLGANAFVLNDIDHCAYLKIIREYAPATIYYIHAGVGGRYCSSGYQIWKAGTCSDPAHYAQRAADGGPGSFRSGSGWTNPPPDYWYHECTFGVEIAEYVDLPIDHTGVWSCADVWAYCHEKHTLCVSEEFEQHVPHIISFRVDMQDLDSPYMQAQSWFGITPPDDANDMEARLKGPEDTDWGARTTDVHANNLLINDTNGAVEKIWTEPSEQTPDKTIIYIDAETTRVTGRVQQGGKLFWENYQYSYAFLDNRASDKTAMIFVGLGAVDPADDNTDILLDWDIIYLDKNGTQHDIKAVLYKLLEITNPTDILDMGLL
jgi:hypothetical protein